MTSNPCKNVLQMIKKARSCKTEQHFQKMNNFPHFDLITEEILLTYRIYSRISCLADKSNCFFGPSYWSKIGNPCISQIKKRLVNAMF